MPRLSGDSSKPELANCCLPHLPVPLGEPQEQTQTKLCRSFSLKVKEILFWLWLFQNLEPSKEELEAYKIWQQVIFQEHVRVVFFLNWLSPFSPPLLCKSPLLKPGRSFTRVTCSKEIWARFPIGIFPKPKPSAGMPPLSWFFSTYVLWLMS